MPPIATGLPEPTRLERIATEYGESVAMVYTPHRGIPQASLVYGHERHGEDPTGEVITLARELPMRGVEVVLVDHPWAPRGRRAAEGADQVDRAWVEVVTGLRRQGIGLRRLTIGGRDSAARVACRTVALTKPDAVLVSAFPLHASRRREGEGATDLAEATAHVPVTVIQGAADALGEPTEVAVMVSDLGQQALTVSVPFCDHDFVLAAGAVITASEVRLILVKAARLTVLQRSRNRGPLLMR